MLALLRPVLSPTLTSFRRFALAGIIANTVIMSTGAAVRLSSSGLGCPDWPRCSRADVAASHNAGQTLLNTWIEFGNRLLNFPLVVITALVFIAAWRLTRQPGVYHGRRDLVWLAAIQPLGVVAQAVVGGIVVLTKLNPAMVSAHFLLSASLVGASVLLYARCSDFSDVGPVRPELRVLSGLLVAVTVAMLAAGTVVTGTGPLAGHADTPRYHLPLEGVTQFHADIGWLMGGITVALVLGLRLSNAGPRAMRIGWIVVIGLFVQGALGYLQYFNHLPAGLVWVHVTTAVMLWIVVLWLFFTLSNGTFIVQQQVTVPQREPETVDR
ncbi:MAG TPA: COX15/CtaA family protein [Streptosporangiaceae bacterium]